MSPGHSERKRYSEEQIIQILRQAERAGNIREVCRPHSSLGYLTPAAVAKINSSLTLSVVQKTGA